MQAPSDIGPALRGLRTIGLRAGSVARLSGTSAAAPSAARLIANIQHAAVWFEDTESWVVRFGGQRLASLAESSPDPKRPTPTPIMDDRFRRGRWRIR